MAPPPATGDEYVWIGPNNGSWDDAANWEDITTGNDPAPTPPGPDDIATIANTGAGTLTIKGTGNAASLALQGAVALDATLTVGTLTNPTGPGGSQPITLDAGSVVTANMASFGTVTMALGADLDVTSVLNAGSIYTLGTITAASATVAGLTAFEADVQIAGGLTLGGTSATGSYNALIDDGTTLQAGSLSVDGTLAVDGISVLEVGTQGGAAEGVITIDAGSVASLGGAARTLITADIVDNGTLILTPGEILFTGAGGSGLGTLSGSGTMEVQPGATMEFGAFAGSVTIKLDEGASLPISNLGAGSVVELAGNDTLSAAQFSSVSGSISGFDETDVIVYTGEATAKLTVTGPDRASLDMQSGSPDTIISLTGDYAGDTVVSVPVYSQTANVLTITEVFLAPPAPAAISPGTSTGDQFVWTGPLNGNWNDAANWQDVTTGDTPALVAPGSLDHVTVANPAANYQVISGTGDAASLALNDHVVVNGTFTVGTLTGGFLINNGSITAGSAMLGDVTLGGNGLLAVDGALTAGTVTDGISGVFTTAAITAASATLSELDVTYVAKVVIAGLLDVGHGTVSSMAGSVVQAGALTLGNLVMNPFGYVEVGSLGDAVRGAVVVDPGATLTIESGVPEFNSMSANVIDNGVIMVEAGGVLAPQFSLSGTGTIVLDGSAHLGLSIQQSTFGTGTTVSMQGTDNSVSVYAGIPVAMRTTGFVAGDKIDIISAGKFNGPTLPSYTLTGTDLAVTIGNTTQHFYLLNSQPGLTFTTTLDASQEGYVLTAVAPCFCPGTLIQTDRGPVPVERLAIGDTVVTLDGTLEPVRWIGQRSYAGAFIAGNTAILPVCIKAGALGDGVPGQDLWVSPGHAMFVDGQLVPASRLVNGVTIVQADAVESVTYYHVELPRHAVLLASGAPAESFLDDDCRNQFQNAASFHAAYPDAAPMLPLAARLEDGFALQSIQDRLAARAGIAPSPEPIGPLRGYVDQAMAGRITGWAQDCDSPEEPVILEICARGIPVLSLPANAYRADLRKAAMGSGCHAFDVTLDPSFTEAITVRRAGDHAVLSFTAPLAVAA